MTSDSRGCVFKVLWRCEDRKQLMHFQSETSVFKFLRSCVDEASVSLGALNVFIFVTFSENISLAVV